MLINTITSAFHSIHQENYKAGVVRRRSQRKAVTRQNTYSDGDWTDSSLSPSSRPFFSAVQSPSSSFPQASATPSLSGEQRECGLTIFPAQSLKIATAHLQQLLTLQIVRVNICRFKHFKSISISSTFSLTSIFFVNILTCSCKISTFFPLTVQ